MRTFQIVPFSLGSGEDKALGVFAAAECRYIYIYIYIYIERESERERDRHAAS